MEKSSERFKSFLQEKNIDVKIIEFNESTKTSQQAADQLNTDIAHIGKSIVFKTQSNNFVVVIASGINRVNEKKIEEELNEKLVKTNGEEIKANLGYPIGGIPPFGYTKEIEVFMDKDLMKFDIIFCAAGTPNSVFEISPAKLVALSNAKIINIK